MDMIAFETRLREYAALLVNSGLNIRPGMRLVIQAPVECLMLVRACAEAAYKAGCIGIDIIWMDDTLKFLQLSYAADSIIDSAPEWDVLRFQNYADANVAKLYLVGAAPNVLKSADTGRIQRLANAERAARMLYTKKAIDGDIHWCLALAATEGWAKIVFPQMDPADAVASLWDTIFHITGVNGDGNAQKRWEHHCNELQLRIQYLNDMDFHLLRFCSGIGTKLTVRLPEAHIWEGGHMVCTSSGMPFSPNMPSEEIATSPDRLGVEGTIVCSKPFVLNGCVIRGARFELRKGRIIKAFADENEEILRWALDIDENARYLGEAALVDITSPVSKTGLLFYQTLPDENAACHFAFGQSTPSIRGAQGLSPAERLELGLNQSECHVDFMVGTPDLSIIGVTKDGREHIVFENGSFAF